MQPNILVIVVDALRADRVGALGGRDLTENIDDLAADSMVFSQAFSTSNATDSAVTSIQTGRYPLSHGIVNHGWKVTDKEKQIVQNTKQLSQALSDHGYRTAKFGRPLGRWHRQGFDEYPETGEWRKSNEIDALTEQEMKLGSMLESMDPRVRSAASWVYQRTVKRLRDYLSSEGSKSEIGRSNVAEKFESFVDSDDPFFSFIHLMDTHAPYQVDTEHTQRCLNRFDYENRPLEEVAMEFPEGSYTRERLLPGGRCLCSYG
jgi:arylsulfatase A-like enzyme